MNQTHNLEQTTDLVYPQHGGRMVLVDWAMLYALLPHWIARNQSRADGFRQWALHIQANGQDETAQQIIEAAERMAACNQALDAALQALEGIR